MCGILGISIKNTEIDKENIGKSYLMLSNRGPDSGNLIIESDKILGFRRLAIMDQSEKGNQPFTLGGNILLCNGEIFNHLELTEKYNINCESSSDCECIIHLYHKLGFEKMIEELSGDFAIILFTPKKIYFGRDRIGVRPLFYGFTRSGNFALASYARALNTYCTNINPVIPGWGEFDLETNKLSFHDYRSVKLEEIDFPLSENISENIQFLLVSAVKSRLMSDRPIGCLLSGGLDSSLITSILCKLIGPQNVRTYSIGMVGSEDLRNAQIVANYLGTQHQEINFTPQEGFEAIREVIRDLESYDITTVRASVGMWLLAKFIKNNSDDVVLYSGEGSDELFAGYLYFHYAPNPSELRNESLRLIKQLHMYDVLRADRCISSHGLELRVPFLDRDLVNYCKLLGGNVIKPLRGIEKYLLRNSFNGEDYLPPQILWRRKDGMSDGISGSGKKKWFEQIQEFVELEVSDAEYGLYKKLFPSKEAYYYKKIFKEIFHKNYEPVIDYWLPKWIETGGDPSGRLLQVYKDENEYENLSIKQKDQLKNY